MRAILILLLTTSFLLSETFNVNSVTQLRDALSTAASNDEDDTIILADGIYKTTEDNLGEFKFTSKEKNTLKIIGSDPKNVILSGENTHRVLNLYNSYEPAYNEEGSSFYLENITIQNGYTNSGSSYGGLEEFYSGAGAKSNINLYAKNIIVKNNNSSDNAGGLYVKNSYKANLWLENSIIENNIGYSGGGFNTWNTEIKNSVIRNNNSTLNGGGFYAAHTQMYNSIVYGNKAESKYSSSDGGAFYSFSSSSIVNSLITNNGSGILLYYKDTHYIVNSIITNNGSYNIKADSSASVDISHSYIEGALEITNFSENIISSGDLGFVDSTNNNYKLTSNSILINKGTNTHYAVEIPQADYEGKNRIVSNKIDIGPYEFSNNTPTIEIISFTGIAKIYNELTFDVTYTLQNNTQINSVLYDFNNNGNWSEINKHTFINPGTYKIKVKVIDSNNEFTIKEKTIIIESKNCKEDNYNCPTCADNQILKFDSNDLAYCEDIPITNSNIKATFFPSFTQAVSQTNIEFFDASSSDEEITKWIWSIYNSNNELISFQSKNSSNISQDYEYTFDVKGEYKVELKVVDSLGNENTDFEIVTINETSDVGEFIILHGDSDNPSDPIFHYTNRLVNTAYSYAKLRGFTDDDIYLMSYNQNLDLNKDGKADYGLIDDNTPSTTKFYDKITNTKPSDAPLYIYMVDHGLPNTFALSQTKKEFIYATKLKEVLDEFQKNTNREVVVIIEACYSGSFNEVLKNSEFKDIRAVFTSSSDIQLSFLSHGFSFSKIFFKNLLKGNSLFESYINTTQKIGNSRPPYNQQIPQFNNYISQNVKNIKIGGDFATASIFPTIEIHESIQNVNWDEKNNATIKVKANAQSGIKAVWATVTPPEYNYQTSNNDYFTPTLDQFEVQLIQEDDGIYKLEYPPSIPEKGTYNVTIFIEDNMNNIESIDTSFEATCENCENTSEILVLYKGWNLVSLPVKTAINYSELNNKFKYAKTIWSYKNGWQAFGNETYQTQLDKFNINKIESINYAEGFWVNSSNSDLIEFTGETYSIDSTEELTNASSGWHLLGTNLETSISKILNSNSNIQSIWTYENGWKAFSPNSSIQEIINNSNLESLEKISKNKGFWIQIK